jgi:hypothetical protein
MATKAVKKPRKQRAKRAQAAPAPQVELLRQGDFEVGFRPNLRPIQQASLLGNLLTNVSNQEKLSALSASLKQYEKELAQAKKQPTVVTTAEEMKPLTSSSQVGRLRDIKFVEEKTKELEQTEFKKSFSQEFGLGTTLEEDVLTNPFGPGTKGRAAAIEAKRAGVPVMQYTGQMDVREAAQSLLANPPSMKPSGGARPQPLATLQRRATPPLPSTSRQISRDDVMAQVRRENVDLRSAQRVVGGDDESMYD